jgi:hypothetical protein
MVLCLCLRVLRACLHMAPCMLSLQAEGFPTASEAKAALLEGVEAVQVSPLRT